MDLQKAGNANATGSVDIMNIVSRIMWAVLWFFLLYIGVGFAFIPFFFKGYRNALGDLWRKFVNPSSTNSSNAVNVPTPNSDVEVFEAQLIDLEKHDKWEKISKLCQTTKAPETREGMLQMLGILEPRLTSDSGSSEWCHHEILELYKKTLNKARIKYSADPDFQYYFNAKTKMSFSERLLS